MGKLLAIHGALEIDNFGDVLLGRIFCDWAREAGWEVTVPSAAPKVAVQLGDLVTANYQNADKILYIGGGYFGEPPRSFLGKLRWGGRMIRLHLSPTRKARKMGVPFAIIGVGAGPVTNPIAKRALYRFLEAAEIVAVRDVESAEFVQLTGVSKEPDITADAALSLHGGTRTAKSEDSFKYLKEMANGRRILVLHPAKRSDDSLASSVIFHALSRVTLPDNLMIVSVSDQRGTGGAEEQKLASQEIKALWPHALDIPYAGVDQLIGILAAADYVVTTKLHVGIVATALGRQVLAFPAHTKTARFYRQVGLDNCCVHIRGDSEKRAIVSFKNMFENNDRPAGQVTEQFEKSLGNRTRMLEFLNNIG